MRRLSIIVLFMALIISWHCIANPTIRDIEEKYKKAVFVVETYVKDPRYVWEGTAFVVKAINNNDGTHTYHFLTNAHVINDQNVEEISWHLKSFNNALSFDTEVLGVDHAVDIGILVATLTDAQVQDAIQQPVLPVFSWGKSNDVQVQDEVMSIGNTQGRGIVSHTGHINSVSKGKSGYSFAVMQTDAATNKGNSGSPILDFRGNLIGVHFQGERETGALVGYEIPADRAQKSYENILKHQDSRAAQYGFWGVFVRPMEFMLQDYYLKDLGKNGVKITNVYADSPADKAGIKPGDILLVDDKIFNDENLFLVNEKIKDSHQDEKITLNILRDGELLSLSLTAIERSYGMLPAYHTSHNFTVAELEPIDLDMHFIKTQGVYVTFDNPKEQTMFGNFKKSTIITKVNGISTPTVALFKQEWEKALNSENKLIVLTVYLSSLQYNNADGGLGSLLDVSIRK